MEPALPAPGRSLTWVIIYRYRAPSPTEAALPWRLGPGMFERATPSNATKHGWAPFMKRPMVHAGIDEGLASATAGGPDMRLSSLWKWNPFRSATTRSLIAAEWLQSVAESSLGISGPSNLTV
jgi:hypothetical protein